MTKLFFFCFCVMLTHIPAGAQRDPHIYKGRASTGSGSDCIF